MTYYANEDLNLVQVTFAESKGSVLETDAHSIFATIYPVCIDLL